MEPENEALQDPREARIRRIIRENRKPAENKQGVDPYSFGDSLPSFGQSDAEQLKEVKKGIADMKGSPLVKSPQSVLVQSEQEIPKPKNKVEVTTSRDDLFQKVKNGVERMFVQFGNRIIALSGKDGVTPMGK